MQLRLCGLICAYLHETAKKNPHSEYGYADIRICVKNNYLLILKVTSSVPPDWINDLDNIHCTNCECSFVLSEIQMLGFVDICAHIYAVRERHAHLCINRMYQYWVWVCTFAFSKFLNQQTYCETYSPQKLSISPCQAKTSIPVCSLQKQSSKKNSCYSTFSLLLCFMRQQE